LYLGRPSRSVQLDRRRGGAVARRRGDPHHRRDQVRPRQDVGPQGAVDPSPPDDAEIVSLGSLGAESLASECPGPLYRQSFTKMSARPWAEFLMK
jgi:hypothetical protein